VYPVLGHLELRQIRPSTIRHWLAGLTMARSYQRTIFANVSQVFAAAVADELIGKNPCQSGTVRKPTADPRKVVPWPREWVDGVIAALPERYHIVAILGVGLGLRQGEIFGLAADDVDFLRGTVEVRRQVKLTAGNRPYLALPKGRKTRTLPLPRRIRDLLAAHLAQHPARSVTLPWDRSDGAPVTVQLIVTSRESGAMNRNYFNAKVWRPALRAAGVPTVRDNGCHALRHYYASLLLDGGESIKTVSERLGRSDPGFTLRTYTHLMPSAEDRTRSIIDAAFDAPAEEGAPWMCPDLAHGAANQGECPLLRRLTGTFVGNEARLPPSGGPGLRHVAGHLSMGKFDQV
jgi:integrase